MLGKITGSATSSRNQELLKVLFELFLNINNLEDRRYIDLGDNRRRIGQLAKGKSKRNNDNTERTILPHVYSNQFASFPRFPPTRTKIAPPLAVLGPNKTSIFRWSLD